MARCNTVLPIQFYNHKSRCDPWFFVLSQIKRLAIARKIVFTRKAEDERLLDELTVDDIIESISRVAAIKKTLRSTSCRRTSKKEKLFIIESPNLSGVWIYTKGTIRKTRIGDVFYILVSSKIST